MAEQPTKMALRLIVSIRPGESYSEFLTSEEESLSMWVVKKVHRGQQKRMLERSIGCCSLDRSFRSYYKRVFIVRKESSCIRTTTVKVTRRKENSVIAFAPCSVHGEQRTDDTD